MNKFMLVLVGGLMAGAMAVSHAKLPAPAPMSDADKAAAASKAAAAKAHDADVLGKAQERAVANYKKGKGMPMESKPATGMKADMKK
jgi:hypothetical protein